MKKPAIMLCLGLLFGTAYAGTVVNVQTAGSQTGVTSVVIINGKVVQGAESQDMVQGSGVVETRDREVADFGKLLLNIGAEVRVSTAEQGALSITADDNLIPVISTEVTDGTLVIGATRNFSTASRIRIDVRVPKLTAAAVNGSGAVHLEQASGQVLDLAITGSGSIVAKGGVERLSASVSGSGAMHLKELAVDSGEIQINGSGRAELSVAKRLAARINGSGEIFLAEEPENLDSQIAGSGKIHHSR